MAKKELSDGGPDGTSLGQSSTDLIGFWGTAPAARRTGTFTTVSTTAAVSTTDNTKWGYASSTQADAIVTRLNECVNVLVAAGLRGAT